MAVVAYIQAAALSPYRAPMDRALVLRLPAVRIRSQEQMQMPSRFRLTGAGPDHLKSINVKNAGPARVFYALAIYGYA